MVVIQILFLFNVLDFAYIPLNRAEKKDKHCKEIENNKFYLSVIKGKPDL
jgi:hypothetical protein